MTNLDCILKSRDISLPTKIHIVKAMVFPVVKYGCERWTIKKAECWWTDAFELWCCRRLLRVPWTARSNQSNLNEINREYSLQGLMLKLQYYGHLMGRADPLENTLISAGKEWRQEKGTTENEVAGWHHQLNGHEFEQTPGDGEGQGAWHDAVRGAAGSWTRLSHWTTTISLQLPHNHRGFLSPSHAGFPRDPQFLRGTSGLLHVKACNVKAKIKNLNFKRSNSHCFICISVTETRPLEDRN